MVSHILYLDDSGTKDYAESPDEYGVSGRSRYFVFGGALLTVDEAGRLTERIISLKNKVFGTLNVEIKSNWLRIPFEREMRYLAPFGLSDEELNEFVDVFYDDVASADLQLLAGVVDKVHVLEDYPSPWYPPAIAYDTVLQRVENELSPSGGTFTVTIDDMSGKTAKGREHRENLYRQHERLKKTGSALMGKFTFDTLQGRLRFVGSELSHMIQVADLAAYNVQRQFRDYGEEWEDATIDQLPTYEYFGKWASKFRHNSDGRIQGFGIVKFPRRKRVLWGVKPD